MSEAATPAAQVTSAATSTAIVDVSAAKDATAPATQAGRLIGEKPAPFRAKTIGSAMERAQAAIAARSQAGKAEAPKAAENAPQAAGESVEAKIAEGGEPKTEEAKSADPAVQAKEAEKQQRLSRGLAIIAEREQKVLAREKQLKAQLAELEARQKSSSDDPFVKLARQLREVQQTGGKAGVLKALGIDLREGIEELSKEYTEPTPEDIARKIAREEYEARQKAESDRIAREKAEQEEQNKARAQVVQQEFEGDVVREFRRDPDLFPFIVHHNVSAENVYWHATQVEKQTGVRPSAIEAMKGVEKILKDAAKAAYDKEQAREKAAQEAQQKANPKPPATVAKTEAKPESKQEQEPAKQQRRKEAEVKPLVTRIQRSTSAIERARAAMANRHLT